MNEKELMIGDIVQQRGCTTPAVVAGLTSGKIHTIWADGSKHSKDAYYFDPIPLTEEILEKNGFDPNTFLTTEWEKKVYFKEFPGCVVESDDSGKYTLGTTCYWDKRDADGSPIDWGTMYESRIEGLHYVHELQHALRLCGLNDLADNLKV